MTLTLEVKISDKICPLPVAGPASRPEKTTVRVAPVSAADTV